jgi:hypothetical protein
MGRHPADKSTTMRENISCTKPDRESAASVAWSTSKALFEGFHSKRLLQRHPLPAELPSKAQCVAALQELPVTRPLPIQVSAAATLFQFRKALPGAVDDDAQNAAWASYKDKLSLPSPPVTPAFALSAKETVSLLPERWWSGYNAAVLEAIPTLKSSRDTVPGSPLFNQQDLLDFCLAGRSPPKELLTLFDLPSNPRTYQAFNDAGKLRCITKATSAGILLLPLHRTLYSALVKTGAVLRGPATPKAMDGMRHSPGETFCSADYQASTDNFRMSNTIHILQLLRDSVPQGVIPGHIWDLAQQFLGPALIERTNRDGEVIDSFTAVTGQRMGDFLSFPLLCLTNLTGLVHGLSLPIVKGMINKKTVKINGDDILFRQTPDRIKQWTKTLPECGLLLETAKTLIHPWVATLNSTFFLVRTYRQPQAIWFCRGSAFLFPTIKASPGRLQRAHQSRLQRAPKLLSRMRSIYGHQPSAKFRKGLTCVLARFSYVFRYPNLAIDRYGDYFQHEYSCLPATMRAPLKSATVAATFLAPAISTLSRPPWGVVRSYQPALNPVARIFSNLVCQQNAWFRKPTPEVHWSMMPRINNYKKIKERFAPLPARRKPARVGLGAAHSSTFQMPSPSHLKSLNLRSCAF